MCIKAILTPLGLLFCFVNFLRRKLYKTGILRQTSLPLEVISVGNLTMGGSGKTPFTIFLAKKLEEQNIKTAIVLRGYKRKKKGVILVEKDTNYEEVGEEALLCKKSIKGEVVVAEKREKAINKLSSLPDVIILDDGFEHLRVKRDIDIILVDSNNEKDLRPFPLGKLREPISSIKDASLIVLTKGRKIPDKIEKFHKEVPLIFADFEWKENFLPFNLRSDEIYNKKFLLLLGIGNPSHFIRMAEEKKIKIMHKVIFPDHAYPDDRKVKKVLCDFKEFKCDFILTSEKDFVKWKHIIEIKDKLIYPELFLKIDDKEKILDKIILTALKNE